jgi:DNA-binding NarL/FixJ family response regulator
VRSGLRGILRARFGFEIVAECGDGGEALAALRQAAIIFAYENNLVGD